MKKYQQLSLLIICCVCVITLLFYRNEYLKLLYVLSVLNFFGNAENNSSCLTFSSDFKENANLKYIFKEPRSVWSKLENHYIYSSFLEEANNSFIRTIAVGPQSAFSGYQCRIWFEEGDIILATQGTFKYALDLRINIKNFNLDHKYVLKCIINDKPANSIPYGVLWITSENTSKFSSISYPRKSSKLTDSVICVLPDYSGVSKTNIIEFISYHNIMGVSDFIIYDSGIQHSIFPFLESLTGSNNILRSITVLQWNFPSVDVKLEYSALKDDCLSRTFGKAKIVGIFKWNEYTVSKNSDLSTIPLNQNTGLTDVYVSTWLCCTDQPDANSAKNFWPLFLRKTSCAKQNVEEKLFFNLNSYGIAINNQTEISQDVVIRRYDTCGDSKLKLRSVSPISKMHSHLLSHKLLMLWRSHVNISVLFN